jgi:hypothetical protein
MVLALLQHSQRQQYSPKRTLRAPTQRQTVTDMQVVLHAMSEGVLIEQRVINASKCCQVRPRPVPALLINQQW